MVVKIKMIGLHRGDVVQGLHLTTAISLGTKVHKSLSLSLALPCFKFAFNKCQMQKHALLRAHSDIQTHAVGKKALIHIHVNTQPTLIQVHEDTCRYNTPQSQSTLRIIY